MADSYRELWRKLSGKLREDARVAGIFDHPTAKGDGRELLLTRYLGPRIGRDLGAQKVEIVDSDGNSGGEYDVAIYDEATASCLHEQGERRVIRVESVAVLLEVKSRLDRSVVDEAAASFGKVAALERYYLPSTFLKMTHMEKDIEVGLPGGKALNELPSIVTGIFAYDGPAVDTATEYLRDVDIVSVLGKYTLVHQDVGRDHAGRMPSAQRVGEGDDALGGFFHVVERELQRFREARSWVWPNTLRYWTSDRSKQ